MSGYKLRNLYEIEQAAFHGMDHFTNAEVRILLTEIERAKNPKPPKSPGPRVHNYELDR